jgi:hypothetical protein
MKQIATLTPLSQVDQSIALRTLLAHETYAPWWRQSHLKFEQEMKGTGFTGSGKYSNRLEFCIRARLQSCRRDIRKTSGFSPCGIFSAICASAAAKADSFFGAFAARLKSCPATERFQNSVFPQFG